MKYIVGRAIMSFPQAAFCWMFLAPQKLRVENSPKGRVS